MPPKIRRYGNNAKIFFNSKNSMISFTEVMSVEEFTVIWKKVKDTLLRLGGPPLRIKLTRIELEPMNLELQNYHIAQFREIWADGRRIVSSPLSTSSNRKARVTKRRKENDTNGMYERCCILSLSLLGKTSRINQ